MDIDQSVEEAVGTITPTSTVTEAKSALERLKEVMKTETEAVRRLILKRVQPRFKGLFDSAALEQELMGSGESERERLPWPDDQPATDAVVLGELLDAISSTCTRHMVLPAGAADAIALWTAHTYAFDNFPISPYLAIMSATKGCGKTTLFQIVGAFARRPFNVANATPATIFRMIEKWHPTLLLDEGDTYLRGNEALRGILNGGHAKSSALVVRSTGDDHEPTFFSIWAPKAFALIGRLPPTLEDRSVRVLLRRKTTTQRVEPLDAEELERFAKVIRSGLLRWAEDKKEAPLARRPTLPGFLVNRAADNWRPLFSIAEDAGEGWLQRVTNAVTSLTPSPEEDEDIVTMLLRDLKGIFANRGEIVFTYEILADLTEDENRPWREYDRAGEITDVKLAQLLKDFQIGPRRMRRVKDGRDENRWGYRAEWFKDIFAAYFPNPEQPEQMEQEVEESTDEPESTEQTLQT